MSEDKGDFSKKQNMPLKIRNLSVDYGRFRVLDNISLNVEHGEFLGIIGPNGGGKSTLLKAALGLISVSGGDISLFGERPLRGRKLTGYVPQQSEFDRQFPVNVEEVVLTGRLKGRFLPFHRYSAEDRSYATELLRQVGILNLRNRQIGMLSGGEFQKMLIARALASSPRLLILDEPTASVDVSSRTQIYELLKELNQKMTIILVTHDLTAISSHVRSMACLNVKMHYHGEPELNETVIGEMYGCPVDLIAHGVPHRMLREHDDVTNEKHDGEGCC